MRTVIEMTLCLAHAAHRRCTLPAAKCSSYKNANIAAWPQRPGKGKVDRLLTTVLRRALLKSWPLLPAAHALRARHYHYRGLLGMPWTLLAPMAAFEKWAPKCRRTLQYLDWSRAGAEAHTAASFSGISAYSATISRRRSPGSVSTSTSSSVIRSRHSRLVMRSVRALA